MVNLPQQVLYAISEHIEPNPVTFTRLALVSRNFYAVFTSDEVWRHLNVFEEPENIQKKYLKSIENSDKNVIKALWNGEGQKEMLKKAGEADALAVYLGELKYGNMFGKKVVTKHFSRCAVNISGHAIRHAPEFLDDKDMALIAVKRHGCVLEYLSKRLRDDRDIVMAAVVTGCPYYCRFHERKLPVLHYARSRFYEDREVVLKAVASNPDTLFYTTEELRQDFEVAYAAVSTDGRALKYAINPLPAVVKKAIKNYPLAVKWAPEGSITHEMALAAVMADGLALEYPALRPFIRYKRVVLAAVRNNGKAYLCALREYERNLQNKNKYEHDPFLDIIQDKDIVKAAVNSNGMMLRYVKWGYDSPEVVRLAVRNYPMALYYAQLSAKDLFMPAKIAVESNGMAIQYVPETCPEFDLIRRWALENVNLKSKEARGVFAAIFKKEYANDKSIINDLVAINPQAKLLFPESAPAAKKVPAAKKASATVKAPAAVTAPANVTASSTLWIDSVE